MPTSYPAGWTRVRLGDLYQNRKESGQIGLPTMSVTMDNGLVDRDSLERRVQSDLAPSQHLLARKGDLVYNTMRMWQGVSGLATEDCMVSPAYVVCKPNARIDPGYGSVLLKSPAMVKKLEGYSQGLTNDRLRLYFQHFAEIPVAIPSPAEQKRIAEILSSVDEALQSTQAVIEQTRRVKEGLLQDLLAKGVGHRSFKHTEIGPIPSSWRLKSLGDVLIGIQAGKSPSAPDEPAGKREWGVLKVSAVGNGQFLPERNKVLPHDYFVSEAHRVRSGDVLITRANTADLVGAVCQVPDGAYRLMLSDKTLRLNPNPKQITSGFLAEVAARPFSRRYFARRATGSSASMKNLSQGKIKSLPIPLPPLAEQREIEEHLSGMREAIAAQFEIEGRLRRSKAGLLQDLLTGKVRVNV